MTIRTTRRRAAYERLAPPAEDAAKPAAAVKPAKAKPARKRKGKG